MLPTIVKQARQAHAWDLSPKEAAELQTQFRPRIITQPLGENQIQCVAGIDVGFPRGSDRARAAIAVLEYPAMRLVDQSTAEIKTPFPYVPGLLSFREIPVILAALENLSTLPDVLLIDGHGLAHPRRFGLACHLGVLLDIPTIGCAKSILVGQAAPLPEARGSTAPLVDNKETIGMAVRTRDHVRPIYVSIGHRVDLASAVEVVLRCGRGYRLPEPSRWAHRLASEKSSGGS